MNNKYLIITGAGGFVGSYFSIKLFKAGFNLILIDQNRKLLSSLKKSFSKEDKPNNLYFSYDLSKENNVKKIFQKLKKKKIQVYGLINLAAIDAKPKMKNNKYIDANQLTKELEAGLVSSYLMIKYFGEEMFKNGLGRIINIGSDLSVISPDQSIYSSSYGNYIKPASYSIVKFGTVGLTKYFSTLFAKRGVTCNMLSPGAIKHKQNRKLLRKLISKTPMKRLANRKDLISTLLYLLDENSNFVTGQNIIIDGGRTLI